jgi:hypothetical protein
MLCNKMKVTRYKPNPPKVPAWAQGALMKYCSKKPGRKTIPKEEVEYGVQVAAVSYLFF